MLTQKIIYKELTHDILIDEVFRCYNFESWCAKYVGKSETKKIKKRFSVHNIYWGFLEPVS
jgi:hypothetical protein